MYVYIQYTFTIINRLYHYYYNIYIYIYIFMLYVKFDKTNIKDYLFTSDIQNTFVIKKQKQQQIVANTNNLISVRKTYFHTFLDG